MLGHVSIKEKKNEKRNKFRTFITDVPNIDCLSSVATFTCFLLVMERPVGRCETAGDESDLFASHRHHIQYS